MTHHLGFMPTRFMLEDRLAHGHAGDRIDIATYCHLGEWFCMASDWHVLNWRSPEN